MLKMSINKGADYAEDFVNATILSTDPDYAGWGGTWEIVAKLNSAPPALASGTLTKLTDPNLRLALRLEPSVTAGLAVGNYILKVWVSNSTLKINRLIMQRECAITY